MLEREEILNDVKSMRCDAMSNDDKLALKIEHMAEKIFVKISYNF
jgi:hypothetical protein